MSYAELFKRNEIIRQFVKLQPGEILMSFTMSFFKPWNYWILCKGALCEKTQSVLSLTRLKKNVIFIMAITTVICDSEVFGKKSVDDICCVKWLGIWREFCRTIDSSHSEIEFPLNRNISSCIYWLRVDLWKKPTKYSLCELTTFDHQKLPVLQW